MREARNSFFVLFFRFLGAGFMKQTQGRL